MAFLGSRLVSNIPVDVRPQDWDSVVPHVFFQNYILTAIQSIAPEVPVTDPIFNWFDKIYPVIVFKLAAGATDMATSLTIDETFTDVTGTPMTHDFIAKGTVLRNTRTGEEVAVTATPTSATISVQRGVGSVAPAAMNAGDILQFQGVIANEIKLAVDAVNLDPQKRVNAVQKFVGIAGDQSLCHAITQKRIEGFDLADQYLDGLYILGQGIEEALLTGTPKLSGGVPTSFTFDGGTTFKTGGFKYLLDTYAPNRIFVDADGIVTEKDLRNYVRQVFHYDQRREAPARLAICGDGFLQTLEDIAEGAVVRYTDEVTEFFGMNMSVFHTSFGTLYLVTHPLLSAPNLYWTHNGVAYERTYSAILLDTNSIYKRQAIPITVKENVQENNELLKKDALYTFLGLQLSPVVTNALFLNFKEGA